MHFLKIRFYGPLNDFLPVSKRQQTLSYSFFSHPTVKDVIQSYGIPHTETVLVLCNHQQISLNHPVHDHDYISVYPPFKNLSEDYLQVKHPEPIRFILDVHLGKLTKYLRMLGIDCFYENDLEDLTIINTAREQYRVILTRDLGILKHHLSFYGYWLRSQEPQKQLFEVIEHYQLTRYFNPLSRCLNCNSLLEPVNKKDILDQIPQKTIQYYNQFYRCGGCSKIFWKGSHFQEMEKMVQNIRRSIK
ncbi:MAG: Mut7-C RNAse domain-containing protein [Candidatus Cyclobacteriaceae bacterium M3_2C_046]